MSQELRSATAAPIEQPTGVGQTPATEERRIGGRAEIRAVGEGEGKILAALAAPFGQETVIRFPWGGGFREIIEETAFDDFLASDDDLIICLDHDRCTAFARRAAKTLRPSKSERGLEVEADLDLADPDVQKVRAKVANGTWWGMSFSFRLVEPDGEEWDESEVEQGMLPLRRLRKLHLYDVAVVTDPAYKGTTVGVRQAADVYAEYRRRQAPPAPDNPPAPESPAADSGTAEQELDHMRRRLDLLSL